MSAEGKSSRRWRRVAVGIGLVLAVVLLGLLVKKLATPGEVKKKRAVQEISLLKPPPPPPPPKTPPPPPKVDVQEKIDVPKPDQQPDKPADAPPPGPDLAVDAAGGAGSDGFGLVGKKGGSDLIGSGGGGSRFAWYGALIKERIQERIQEMMSKDKKLRKSDYRIMVNVWVNATGTVTRAELIDSTNDGELDSALKVALRNLPPLREGAPSDMPQPIKLRITAR
ncbi:energy transducer TonB [Rhodoferax sp.]|uniref:energy transducer TonB family protein n=1 Tax=Rhodoferax sp. TaxID=50421 RepID=UPI00271F0E1C|nr:energy transducer TonB [Rhodoferax sp.]MDO9195874.1 energy transducer TonB [Rhodoferax sp.]